MIKGTWTNGGIVLDEPADWPDGCRVTIEPATGDEAVGVREEDWADTPEEIADWLRWYDRLEPLETTREEEAELAAWRRTMREHSIAEAGRRCEGLFE